MGHVSDVPRRYALRTFFLAGAVRGVSGESRPRLPPPDAAFAFVGLGAGFEVVPDDRVGTTTTGFRICGAGAAGASRFLLSRLSLLRSSAASSSAALSAASFCALASLIFASSSSRSIRAISAALGVAIVVGERSRRLPDPPSRRRVLKGG